MKKLYTFMANLEFTKFEKLVVKIMRFGIVGAVSVIIYAVMAYLLTNYGGIEPVWASVTAYAIAIPVSFLGHKYFTFGSSGNMKTETPLFVLLQLCGLAVAAGLTAFITKALGWHSNIAILVVCVVLPPTNYFIMSLLIFTQSSR